MQYHPQLNPHTEGSNLKKTNGKKYQQKAVEAAGYLRELFIDAVDYTPGQLQNSDGIYALEIVTVLGTKFTVAISFTKSELQLRANFPSGIIQTEYAKIRHFIEDLECYLNAAHQW
ncbi:MAG: hypothetical protein EOO42_04970 [Flavobacteriales bacterium]|nr:MAG: hypothetical protein EOO42_04970 [Flavobacteriales bacterium]